jgi:hypothetical protein
VLLNVTANRLYRFEWAMTRDGFGPAAQASAVASLLSLMGLGKKSNVLAAGAPRRARWPAVHTGRRDRKNEPSVLAGVTRQNGLPAQISTLLFIALVAALVAGGHLHRFRQVEYRIACHNVVSLEQRFLADYPHLAVKATLLRYADSFETQFSVPSSPFSAMSMRADNAPASEIVATYVDHELSLDASHIAQVWQNAGAITFDSDWQGKNADPKLETEVRALWSRQHLYLMFECRYRELFVFKDSDANGHRDHLWDRDVAEVFLQPDPSREHLYREFEVSPNGMWIDLDIFPAGRADFKSGLQRSVTVNEKSHAWTAQLAIPMKSLTSNFDPSAIWRANFYRVEGKSEPRAYLAWQPTNTPQPNFHVPNAFGKLRFAGAPGS